MRCHSCQVLTINGVPCHETGCPDAWCSYYRDCAECGVTFMPESRHQKVCSEDCYRAYYNIPDCEEGQE